jgi:hypothetical protein
MTTTEANLSNQATNVVLPMPNEDLRQISEQAIYARFMRHLRHVPNSRMAIKILSSIQFTADMLGYSDAHVAKTLVDLGLRAPRMAFPADFLSFMDASLMRSGWEVGGPSAGILALKEFWDSNGEDKFAGFRKHYSLLDEKVVIGR